MEDRDIEKLIQRTVAAGREYSQAEHERISKMVDKMHDTLYGNGREGLTTTVDRLERAVEGAQDVWKKVVATLVTTIVIGTIILIVQANLLKP